MYQLKHLAGLALLVAVLRCTGAPASTAPLGATINGSVLDENSTPLSGVTISVGGQTTQSDTSGHFVVFTTATGIQGTLPLYAVLDGYAHVVRRLPVANSKGDVQITMRKADLITTFTLNNANTVVNLNVAHADVSSAITFYGNTLQSADGNVVTGNVQATLTMWSPNDAVDSFSGVLRATLPDGSLGDDSPRILRTYGMVDILLQQNGNTLQIIPGQTALLDITTNATMREGYATRTPAVAAPTLWTLDTNTGLWNEDVGDGTYDPNTGILHATLRHLSTKNSDEPITPTNSEGGCIRGKVVDLCGKAVAGATVQLYLQSWLFPNVTIPVQATTDGTGAYAITVNPATHMGYYGYASYTSNTGGYFTTNTILSMQQGFLPNSVQTTTVPGDSPEYDLIPLAVLLCSSVSGQCVDSTCSCYNDVNDNTCLASIDIPGGSDGRDPCWANPMGQDSDGSQCYVQYNMYKSWTGITPGSLCQNCWPVITLQLPFKQVPTCTGVGGIYAQSDPCQTAAPSSVRGMGQACSILDGDVCCPSVGTSAVTCADNVCVPINDPTFTE